MEDQECLEMCNKSQDWGSEDKVQCNCMQDESINSAYWQKKWVYGYVMTSYWFIKGTEMHLYDAICCISLQSGTSSELKQINVENIVVKMFPVTLY